MGIDHVKFGDAGTRQPCCFAEDPVVESLVLAIAMEGIDGGNDPTRQGMLYVTDKMQRYRAFTQQVDVQRREHKA